MISKNTISVVSGEITIESDYFEFQTNGEIEIIDLTPKLDEFVNKHGIRNGTLTIFVSGSTGAVGFTEYEPRLIQDNKTMISDLIPSGVGYRHDEIDNNAHSHLRTTLVGSDISIPIINGSLVLGTWQQAVFFEFDVRPRQRRIVFQVMGLVA